MHGAEHDGRSHAVGKVRDHRRRRGVQTGEVERDRIATMHGHARTGQQLLEQFGQLRVELDDV